jgi:hypothetical protein
MKSGPKSFGSAKNESGSAKDENETGRPRYSQKRARERKTWKQEPTPLVPLKTSPGMQNVKKGPDALGTAENMSGSEKHENGIGRPEPNIIEL